MVLATPGVGRPAVGAAVGSLPIGFLGLAVLLLVQQEFRSGFAGAGLVVGLLGIGTGAGMAFQGRLIDRFGPPRILLAAAGLQVAALTGLVEVVRAGGPVGLVAVLAAVAGAGEPQVGGSLRGLWADLLPEGLRGTAVAVSSALFEGPVLAGPLLLVGLLAAGGPVVAVLAAAACSATGAWLLARSPAARARGSSTRRVGGRVGVLRSRGIRTVVAVTVGQGLVTGLVQVPAAAAAARHGDPGRAPLLYAALSVGSLFGTVGYGARRWTGRPGRQLIVLLTAVAAATAGTAVAPGLGWLAVGLFTAGLVLGPVAVCCFGLVEGLAPPGARVEAFTTVTAFGLAGFAAGTATAGVVVDHTGPAGGFLAAAVAAAVTAATVHTRRSTLR